MFFLKKDDGRDGKPQKKLFKFFFLLWISGKVKKIKKNWVFAVKKSFIFKYLTDKKLTKLKKVTCIMHMHKVFFTKFV